VNDYVENPGSSNDGRFKHVMDRMEPVTFFAPAARATRNEVMRQRKICLGEPMLVRMLSAIPTGMVLLNRQRQIVAASESLLEIFHLQDDENLVGLRVGEALGCRYADKGPGGCGTSEACRTCGAVNAMMDSMLLGHSRRECRITTLKAPHETTLELSAWSTEIEISGETFLVFSFKDISDENRRRALERIFFHDILNTAGGLKGFAELLKAEASGDLEELAGVVYDVCNILISEIEAQRQLSAAENGELQVNPSVIRSKAFLRDLMRRFREHDVLRRRTITLDEQMDDVELTVDQTILGRVLVNLVKNALEATPCNQGITLGSRRSEGVVEFWVNNPGMMTSGVQKQIFQKSFSTKGKGRGLGTYGVKLLTEGYLKGTVCFQSSENSGTTFLVRIPINVQTGNTIVH
jgi:PAS domain-containing protein